MIDPIKSTTFFECPTRHNELATWTQDDDAFVIGSILLYFFCHNLVESEVATNQLKIGTSVVPHRWTPQPVARSGFC